MRWPASPTADLLAVFGLVYAAQLVGGIAGVGVAWFALSLPLDVNPWTVVTSVYAHGSPSHLLANAAALAVVGFALERFTTRVRFHAFVLATGILAGLSEVLVGGLLGGPTTVLGASGAVLALYGYVIAGNPIAGGLLGRLDLGRRGTIVLLAAIVVLFTLLTARSGVALVAHATGLILGLVSGRFHMLRAG